MKVPPPQRDGEVGSGVDAGKIVQLGVIGNPLRTPTQPGSPRLCGRLFTDKWKQVLIGILWSNTVCGPEPVHSIRSYSRCRVVHPMRQPGAMERGEYLERLSGPVLQRARRHRVRRPGPDQCDFLCSQGLRDAL